jgi:hypothetical protein
MAFQDKKEGIKVPEKKIPAGEQAVHFEKEGGRSTERREISPDDKIVSAELRKEIEMMEVDDKTKNEAKKKAEKIEFLGEKEKIEHLLDIAREKGVVFAIQVAKKTNEPYILDILHDVLAQEGFYKGFVNKVGQKPESHGEGKKLFIYIIVGLVIVLFIFVIYKLWR